MRESVSICFKNFSISSHPSLYFSMLNTTVYVMLFQLILFSVSPAYAEEPRLFTDSDLVKYNAEPMVDQETLSHMEEDMNFYKNKKDTEFLQEKEKMKRQHAEEAKRMALQKKKQDVTVSRAPVSIQKSGNNSGIASTSSPVSKRRT